MIANARPTIAPKPVARPVAAARRRSGPSAYWLAWLATVTFFAGFYALLVPLPRYLTAVGLPDWQIGLVLGAFGVASLVGRPVAGVATDRFGSRRVMLVGAASLTVGALGVPLTGDVAVLFALRVVQAVGYVAFTTAGTALVVSLVAPTERARRLAIFGAAANLAISLTPAAISALLEVAPVAFGLLAAAALGALGGLLSLLLPAASPPPARPSFSAKRNDRPKQNGIEGVTPGAVACHKNALSVTPSVVARHNWTFPRRLWLPMLATGLLGAGFAAFFQFAPILAERRGIESGLLYATYGTAIIATRLVGGRVLDRFSVGRVVVVGAALMAVGHVLIATSNGLALVLIAAAFIAASGGLFHPALLAHHAALLPDTPGRASAAFYVAFDLGLGLGSWIFGLALQWAGLAGLYATAAALVIAVLPLAPRLSRKAENALG